MEGRRSLHAVVTAVTTAVVSVSFIVALVVGIVGGGYTALKVIAPLMTMQALYAFGAAVVERGLVVRRLNGGNGQ